MFYSMQYKSRSRYCDGGDEKGQMAAPLRPLRLEAAILSRTRSPITSRSNWAKESTTLSVSRPMLEMVLNAWVIDTNDTPC
jgi:hypothetical protein